MKDEACTEATRDIVVSMIQNGVLGKSAQSYETRVKHVCEAYEAIYKTIISTYKSNL